MNDMFEKLLKQTVGEKPKKATLEEQLASAQRQAAETQGEIDRLNKMIEEQKGEEEEREIIIRYIPNKPLSVRFIKGEELKNPNEPDNAVALIDAASHIMSNLYGINQAALTAMLLNSLVKASDLAVLLKEVLP